MSIVVANTANTNTFYYWKERTNDLAHAMTNFVITTDSNSTIGNAHVTGNFSATTLSANNLRGGNTTVTTVLTVTSNIAISATQLMVGNSSVNAVINSTSLLIGTAVVINTSSISINGEILNSNTTQQVNTQTSGTSGQIVDSFLSATFRAVEYIVSTKDNNANGYQSNKLMVLQYGSTTDAMLSEYAVLFSNAQLAVFSANANATHCRLIATPTSTNTQVKAIRMSVVI